MQLHGTKYKTGILYLVALVLNSAVILCYCLTGDETLYHPR